MPTLPTTESPNDDRDIVVLDLDSMEPDSLSAALNSAQVAGGLVKTLNLSIVNDALLKSVNQMAESHAKMIATLNLNPILEAHTRMLESIKPMQGFMESVQQIGAQVASMVQSVAGNGLLGIARQAHERTVEMFKALTRNLRLPTFIGLFQRSFAGLANIMNNAWSRLLQPIVEFWRQLQASNIHLIVRASKGDEIATHTLAKMWWRLWPKFRDFKREQGEDATWEAFCSTITVTCWEVLQEEENGHRFPLLRLAAIIFNRLRYQLVRDRIVIIDSNEGSALSVYSDENANIPAGYFTKAIARQAEVTPETIRNWIRSGRLNAVKIPYQLQSLGREVSAYLVLDEPNMIADLYAVKREMATRQRHQKLDLYNVSQVAKEYSVSRRTLERWDKAGILSPQRIDGCRYYTQADLDVIPGVMVKNASPKIKALIARGLPSPA